MKVRRASIPWSCEQNLNRIGTKFHGIPWNHSLWCQSFMEFHTVSYIFPWVFQGLEALRNHETHCHPHQCSHLSPTKWPFRLITQYPVSCGPERAHQIKEQLWRSWRAKRWRLRPSGIDSVNVLDFGRMQSPSWSCLLDPRWIPIDHDIAHSFTMAMVEHRSSLKLTNTLKDLLSRRVSKQ